MNMSDLSDQWWAEYTKTPEIDARARRNAAKGEKKIGRELAWLGDEWHVLHVVESGVRDVDIDHVLIGPAGVFTLTTRRLRNSKVLVDGSTVLVDGCPQDHLVVSRRDAHRVELMLSDACGRPVQVRAVVVFVDLDELTVQQKTTDVHVMTGRQLLPWLKSLPETTDFSTIECCAHAITRRAVA